MNKLFDAVCAYYLAWEGAKLIESRPGYSRIGNGLPLGTDGEWDVEIEMGEGEVAADGSGVFKNQYGNYDLVEFGGVWFTQGDWDSWCEYQAMAEAEAKAMAQAERESLTPEEFQAQALKNKRMIRQNYLP